MIILLEALIAYQVQDDIVSNDFAVKGSESECLPFLAAYQVMLRICQERKVPWNHLNLSWIHSCIVFHNNSVSKKS